MTVPEPSHGVAVASVAAGLVGAIVVAFDDLRSPQTIGVMDSVWRLTALFGSVPRPGSSYRRGRRTDDEADTASIGVRQVGMGGATAIGRFAWLRPARGPIAPVAGFAAACAVACWLVRKGKEGLSRHDQMSRRLATRCAA